MIRVVVVDDESLVRSGFDLILEASPEINVVATTMGSEAVATVRRELRALPTPPVVAMLTTFDADDYVLAALDRGAAGFLLKDTEPDQLAHLVRTLADGRSSVLFATLAGFSLTLLAGGPKPKNGLAG